MSKLLFFSILQSIFSLPLYAQSAYDRKITQAYFQNQDYENAALYLKTIDKGDDLQVHLDLGYAYFMAENYLSAINYYRRALGKDPQNQSAHLYLAQSFDYRMQPDSSLFYYKQLTVLYPGQYKYWQKAAQHFSRQRYEDSALFYFEKSFSLNPKSGEVAAQYAGALAAKKDIDRAMSIINAFLKQDSSNTDVIIKKMDLSFGQNKHYEVIFWGEKLLRDSVSSPSAFTKLAYSYLNTQNYDKSLALYNKMESENMSNESLVYCAALCNSAKENYKESNRLLDLCLKQNLLPSASIYLRAKAENFEAIKDFKKTIQHYDTSYYIFHNPIDLYLAGRIYDQHLKNRDKAGAYYLRYLKQKKAPSGEMEKMLFEYMQAYLKGK